MSEERERDAAQDARLARLFDAIERAIGPHRERRRRELLAAIGDLVAGARNELRQDLARVEDRLSDVARQLDALTAELRARAAQPAPRVLVERVERHDGPAVLEPWVPPSVRRWRELTRGEP